MKTAPPMCENYERVNKADREIRQTNTTYILYKLHVVHTKENMHINIKDGREGWGGSTHLPPSLAEVRLRR